MHYCFMSLGQWENSASLVRVRELGAALLKKGVRVSYLVDDAWSNRGFKKFPEGSNVEWVIPAAGLKQFGARRAILRRLKPDYVHVLNPSPKTYLTLRFLCGRKIVADWDEWSAERTRVKWRRWRDHWIDGWFRKRAVLQAVSSRYMQAAFEARYGRRPLYLPYATYMQTKAETPAPFTEPTAVYMGNLYAEYDHDLIFKAAEVLKARGLSPRIEILGSGPEIEHWRAYVRDRGLGNVHVAGFVSGDDLWARLRHAHVLLFPIRPTPGNLSRCPSKTYSYAQARRPIIACRVSEVPEVLGEAAQYVDPTAEAFADALEAAMQRPQPDVDYGVERHNWDIRAEALLAALKGSEGNS